MTPATLTWGRRTLPTLAHPGSFLTFGDVIEIGARNVNGSFRPFVEPHALSYIGTDLVAGPGVDLVIPARDLVARFGHERFDLVICTETIEHIEHWGGAIWAMKALVRSGGHVVVTTRAPGFPRHEYPSDFWRFTTRTLTAAFDDFDIIDIVHDLADHGVYIAARRLYDGRPLMPIGAAERVGE